MPDQRMYPAFAQSQLPHVGTYRRALPVSLERMYENTLDWAHLPHVHGSSFNAIACEAEGPWGWRARTTTCDGETLLLELRLDRECRRWITRTLEGTNAGSEIWTHAFAVAERRTDVVVDFFVPGVNPADRDKIGAAFCRTYTRLYDEDVAMMQERQRQLDVRIQTQAFEPESVCVGSRATLALPMVVTFNRRPYHLTQVHGELVAHVTRCPHQLGPLPVTLDGTLRCPWHGYEFDVKTGVCLSGQVCRLPQAPVVAERDGHVWLEHCPT
jgi:nitrite reductase/ring-hydroxylating ferredoxin subunit